MIKPILKWPKDAKALKEVSEEVKNFGTEFVLHDLIEDLIATNKASNGYGLSAVQIGVASRVMITDFKAPMVFINPKIVEATGRIKYEERCLSFPGMKARTKRRSFVRISYQDETGAEKTYQANGVEAVCLLHEIDHMDGILLNDNGHLVKG